MSIKFKGAGGSGTLSVDDNKVFPSTAVRDAYFATNPSQLVESINVVVAGQLQQYRQGAWTDISPIVTGPAGQDAPNMVFQFSADGSTSWSGTLNTGVHKYWRWSTDNGVTWSPNGIRYSAEGAGLTPQQEQDLTDNTAARHTHTNKTILDATTGTFTLARQNKLDGVQDTFRGTFANQAAIVAALPTPVDGWAAWNTDTATVWSALGGVWSDTLATSVGDMLKATYDPQGISGDAFDRAKHTGTQAISTIDGLQLELDKLPVMQGEIDALEDRFDNPVTGVVKAITDLDTQINAVGTGLKDRVTDLEQGGTATMKYRTHTSSGVYEDGEVVLNGTVLYKANSAIDGSVTPVPFVRGTGVNTWTYVGSHDPELPAIFYKGTMVSKVEPVTNGMLVSAQQGSEGAALYVDGVRKRLSMAVVGTNPISAPTAADLLFLGDLNGAISPVLRTNFVASRAIVSSSGGKLDYSAATAADVAAIASSVTPADVALADTDGFLINNAGTLKQCTASSVKTYVSGAFIGKGFTANPTGSTKLAYVNTSGNVTYSASVTVTEAEYLNGVSSNIQTQLNGKLTSPSHLTATTYGSDNGIRLRTTQPNVVFGTNGSDECYISGGGHFRPLAAGQSIGLNSTTGRWDVIYLSGGVNNSSDEDLKTNIKTIPDALLDVWFDYVQPLNYEWIAKQGKVTNKISVGFIAQDVIAAFEAAGIDWHEWDVVSEGADLDHDDDPLVGEKDDYYSLNYVACQLIESMAIRRKLSIKQSKRFRPRSFWNKLWWGSRGKPNKEVKDK